MGHGFLYQSDAAGRIGAIFARSQNSHSRGEKVKVGRSNVARGSPESSNRFAILRDSARYPNGPRERSAKPLGVLGKCCKYLIFLSNSTGLTCSFRHYSSDCGSELAANLRTFN